MTLSGLVLAASLLGAPVIAAADPAPVSDAAQYEKQEKQAPDAAKFVGGGEAVVYIGGSALTLVLIILLIVIVF